MALISDGKTSLISFFLGLSVLLYPLSGYLSETISIICFHYWRILLAGDIAVINAILFFVYKGYAYQIAIRSYLLGLAFGVGLIVSWSESSFCLFGWYLTTLAFFHWSEYFTTALTNPTKVTLESFLLDHSREYHAAAIASIIEFTVEWYFFPTLKQPSWISMLGLAMVVGGELFRKGAMVTARTNFNHYVQHVKHEGHQLVTHGLYSVSRHPSYVGWFYWSIGTQVMLCNPVCMIGYAWASWKFFKFRIEHEEVTLLNFFGEEYLEYQRRVGTLMPCIAGYRMEL